MVLKSSEGRVKDLLQQRLLVVSFINLLIVALLGVLLRLFPFLSFFPLDYKHILHGHSHFAFGGWVVPVLLSLVMKRFSPLKEMIAYRHWRNIAVLVLLSAYGMLLSFPLQGYAPASIFFSTLSIIATVYLTIVVWKAAEGTEQKTSLLFLKWGLLYGCLSAIGPFATGPLVAMGKGGSALYFDAIYFYLHFQYNGFFTFTALALLYTLMEKRDVAVNGKRVFLLFNSACVPAYALSVLWSEPSGLLNWIGGFGTLLQVVGVFYLWKDVAVSKIFGKRPLLKLSFAAFVLKNGLQLLSAFPFVALMAYHNRNFVIAYLHLVLLGFISLAVFGMTLKENTFSRIGVGAFLFSFTSTELLLVLNASSGFLHFDIPYFVQLLLFCSLFFPIGITLLLFGFFKRKHVGIKTHSTNPSVVVSLT